MNRRKFVVLAASSFGAITLTGYYYLKGTADNAPASLSMIWDTDTIVDIGTKYRLQVPAETTKAALAGLLSTKESAEQKTLEDFKADKTVLVDGWILSVTEARQCALFSLTEA